MSDRESSTDERRRFPRVRRRVACVVKWNGQSLPGWVGDCSASGLLVQARLARAIRAEVTSRRQTEAILSGAPDALVTIDQ